MCSVCWLSFGITNFHEKQVPGVPCVWLRCWFCNSCVLEVFQLFSVNGLLRGLSQIEANQNMISPSWRKRGAELSHRFPRVGRGAACSPFLFFHSFIFPLTFCRLSSAGCDFCFPLPRWDRPVLSLCPQSLWQPGQLWWCCCRAHLPERCCRGFLLQLILDPYASPAETTKEFWLRCFHFLCPPWFKLVTSITYPWICKVHSCFK